MRDAHLAMDNVVGYLRTVDPGAVAAADRAYDCFRPYGGDPKYFVLARTCRDEVDQVYQQLLNHQSIYVNSTSQRAFVAALQNARVVQQAEEMLASADLLGFKRNLFMAENIAWLLEQSEPGSKLILWGHNTLMSDGDNTLGYYLRQQFGEQMVNVGFSFYQGDFNARPGLDMPPTPLTFGVPDPRSFEHIAHQTGWPRFYMDLRAVADPVGQVWLNQAIPFHGVIGAGYDETRPLSFIEGIQPDSFDIIIYIDNTTPSTLLPLLPVYAGQIME
jgi:erythromycin esterase-like protein